MLPSDLAQTFQEQLQHQSLLVVALAPILIIPALIYIATTISWHISVTRLASSLNQKGATHSISPPILPYSLPFLGVAFSFLSRTPGKFWRYAVSVLRRYPALSIFTIYAGGRKIHVLYSPKAVTTFFKTRDTTRNGFNRDAVIKGLLMNPEDATTLYGSLKRDPKTGLIDESTSDAFEHQQHEYYTKYLLAQNAVNILTKKYIEVFQRELHDWYSDISQAAQDSEGNGYAIPLTAFLKQHIFVASTTATYGSEIFKFVPNLAKKYWVFDTGFLPRFLGLPRLLFPVYYEGLTEFREGMVRWLEAGNAFYDNAPPQEEVEWEPHIGSQLIRVRRKWYGKLGLSIPGMASLDMGLLFGLQSNVIPTTSWLLLHLLTPANASLLAKVQEEVDAARKSGGDLDMMLLLGAPYLNSVFYETLRMYADLLVTRELRTDTVLGGHFLKAGEVVMAPTYIGHHDGNEWNTQGVTEQGEVVPPEGTWFGERFLKMDEKTGKVSLSTRDTTGKYFPFGGGKSKHSRTITFINRTRSQHMPWQNFC